MLNYTPSGGASLSNGLAVVFSKQPFRVAQYILWPFFTGHWDGLWHLWYLLRCKLFPSHGAVMDSQHRFLRGRRSEYIFPELLCSKTGDCWGFFSKRNSGRVMWDPLEEWYFQRSAFPYSIFHLWRCLFPWSPWLLFVFIPKYSMNCNILSNSYRKNIRDLKYCFRKRPRPICLSSWPEKGSTCAWKIWRLLICGPSSTGATLSLLNIFSDFVLSLFCSLANHVWRWSHGFQTLSFFLILGWRWFSIDLSLKNAEFALCFLYCESDDAR